MPGGLSVAGYFRATSGIAEGARRQLRLLDDLGFEPAKVDLTEAIIPDRVALEAHFADHDTVPHTGGCVIMNANPPEFMAALAVSGVGSDVYRIGYWAWELEDAPQEWELATRLVNEIWVPSEFCAKAIRRITSVPVYVLPHPLEAQAGTQMAFSLPNEACFTVLFAYDVLSSHARKNPEAAIRAFRMGLDGCDDARLIIKVSNLKHSLEVRNILSAVVDGDCRIEIIDAVLSDVDMAALLGRAHVVLSLHRSEGFGLLLAQAMLAGKAVIATGWSGNLDFMDAQSSFLVPFRLVDVVDPQRLYRHGHWAEPDVSVAAQHLRACYDDRNLLCRIGEAARDKMHDVFMPEVEFRFRARLHALGLQAGTPGESAP